MGMTDFGFDFETEALRGKYCVLFDRDAAVDYARKWATHDNPDFPMWNYIGGDCTNFVSQALYAGGWRMVQGHQGDATAWWCKTSPGIRNDIGAIERRFWGASWGWTSANHFAQFIRLSRRARSAHFTSALDLGDVVQISKDGVIHHTMIVTAKKDGEVYLSYHSRHLLDQPFSDIAKKYANHTFLNWQILDEMPSFLSRTDSRRRDRGNRI